MAQQDTPLTRSEYFKINGILDHTFSPDGKFVALSLKKQNTIEVYEIKEVHDVNSWKLVIKIKEQSLTISSIAWSSLNKLLSCSFDRSVMVWNPKPVEWSRDLVIIENQRSALVGVWSKNGKKFGVGSGDHRAFIGYYDPKQSWWQTKKITGFKSSVISISFHPSNKVIACGSSDFSLKIITACIVEQNVYLPEHDDLNYKGPFQEVKTFGDIVFSFNDTGGWVQSILFSPQGNSLVFAVQNGTVHLISITEAQETQDSINYNNEFLCLDNLPFKCLVYTNESQIVGGGFNGKPAAIKIQDKKLIYVGDLTKKNSQIAQQAVKKTSALKDQWEQKQISKGMVDAGKGGKTLGQGADHRHLTPITSMNLFTNQISTSDINGQLLFWDV